MKKNKFFEYLLMYISNVTDIKKIFLYYKKKNSIEKYIKKLLGIPGLYIKERL